MDWIYDYIIKIRDSDYLNNDYLIKVRNEESESEINDFIRE